MEVFLGLIEKLWKGEKERGDGRLLTKEKRVEHFQLGKSFAECRNRDFPRTRSSGVTVFKD